ncbi:hypothetical protein [Pedobacter sp.]|uniref:hypothetical protein n=1 Tax=Pedobacter sp. TaxID=1411316 RepID=UPI0031DB871E
MLNEAWLIFGINILASQLLIQFMRKKMLTLCILFGTAFMANAQNPAKEGYRNFTVYRTAKGSAENIAKMKALLQQQDQLSSKQVTNLQYQRPTVDRRLA